MNAEKTDNFIASQEVAEVVEQIIRLISPMRIYLYNQRIDAKYITTSFKLCIIAAVEDKYVAERDIYMEIDCDIPFDILLYSPEEWEELTSHTASFAHRIKRTGTVVYDG